MRWGLLIVGVVLLLVGAVWTLQGINILQGSPMTGDSFWATTGAIVFVVGVLVSALGWRRAARRVR